MNATGGGLVRVLYVEDAFDQAILVKSFLESTGLYDVTHSQDGFHASKLLESRDWDILITDLNLPGVDGFQLIRTAKERNPDMAVLATTGYTAAAYVDQAFRSGADDLLNKPLNREEFLTKVQQLTSTAAPGSGRPTVIALGGLPGDVEMGCAGALLQALSSGREAVVIPLCRDELDPDGAGLEGARRAGELLGFRLLVDERALDDTGHRMSLVERLVREVRPVEAYIPAMDERHPARMEAFRIGKATTSGIPRVYGYQTATTGFDFQPSHFVPLKDYMATKMEALAEYHHAGAPRVDLSPRLAQAYARYWGRFQRFTEVEAFEVVREDS